MSRLQMSIQEPFALTMQEDPKFSNSRMGGRAFSYQASSDSLSDFKSGLKPSCLLKFLVQSGLSSP